MAKVAKHDCIYYDEKRKTYYLTIKIKQADGTYKSICKRGFKLRREAEDYKDELLLAPQEKIARSNPRSNPSDILMELINEYLENHSSKTKASTIRGIEYRINAYITPHMINYPDLESMFSEYSLRAWKKSIISTMLSTTTKNKIIGLLKQIILRGIARGIIKETSDVKIGMLQLEKIKNIEFVEKRKFDFYTLEEFKQFISATEQGTLPYVFFTFLFYTGVRKSEARGLTWNRIDLNKSIVRIDSQVYYDGNGSTMRTTTKSKSGVRDITIHEELKNILKKWHDSHSFKEFDFVFPSLEDNSKPYSPTTIERLNQKIAKKSGLRKIKIHEFRHSHASYLIHLNAPPKYIQVRLGHADITETLNTYSHLYPNTEIEIIQNFK